jgi:hypothetical protein
MALRPEASPDPPSPDRDARFERRFSLAVLALLSVAFLAYNALFVPRLGNVNFGDLEFTGWSSPQGSRLLAGERPYVDFILPIPPGSFVLLAALEWAVGKPLLLPELWLNAVAHLAMAWLAYLMALPLTARRNALLVAFCTLVTVVQLNKECAYDHTAQLVAWSSFVVGVRALLATGPRRRRLWVGVGFLAAFTLFFKQSTAIGAVAAWAAVLGYLGAVEGISGHRTAARAVAADALPLGRGVAYGLAATWAGLIALGSTGSAFFEATFLDASVLKGGLGLLVKNVVVYLFAYPSYPGSLLLIAVFVIVALLIVAARGGLGIGDEPRRASPISRFDRVFLPAVCLLTFGSAAALLALDVSYPLEWMFEVDRLKQVPAFGLVFTALFFVTHLVKVPPRDAERPLLEDTPRMGHVLNALWLGALACSILHNTSAPEFRPFYDNNPIIPLAYLAFLVALDRARARWLQAGVVLLVALSLGGNRFYRSLIATTRATPGTFWSGMRLSERGVVMDRVARRVRALTAPTDTVLVLPEDVQLASQIGRPRPKLSGAIVFVDQYAPRLVSDDLARLDANPPKVIVIHPRDALDWQRFFRIWSGQSGAERMMHHVLGHLLPARYRRDRSYPTVFLWEPATLDLYVRQDDEAPGDAATEDPPSPGTPAEPDAAP